MQQNDSLADGYSRQPFEPDSPFLIPLLNKVAASGVSTILEIVGCRSTSCSISSYATPSFSIPESVLPARSALASTLCRAYPAPSRRRGCHSAAPPLSIQ